MTGWVELGDGMAGFAVGFSCTRYLHRGGGDGLESSSVRSDKLSGRLGAPGWRHGLQRRFARNLRPATGLPVPKVAP
jgi:hypothetical protein